MKQTIYNIENSLLVRKWEDSPNKELKSVFGVEFITTEGRLFDDIIKTHLFKEMVSSCINREPSYSGEEVYIEHLKKAINGAKAKITIKIELEKYE